MPRLVGLAQASKIFRHLKEVENAHLFSNNGNEVAWGTIGNASTSEGVFFEAINAAGVMQIPMVTSIWDDEYGISVHAKHQTTKESISEILKGFQRENGTDGYEIFVVNGWDYVQLIDIYARASKIAREDHIPVLIHVKELTQPQGHSTSGSHERYKSPKRLQWEREYDCIEKMRQWILDFELEDTHGNILRFVESEEELLAIDKAAKKEVSEAKRNAWNAFLGDIKTQINDLTTILEMLSKKSSNGIFIRKIKNDLTNLIEPIKKDVMSAARKVLRYLRDEDMVEKSALQNFIKTAIETAHEKYSAHLISEHSDSVLNITENLPQYSKDTQLYQRYF